MDALNSGEQLGIDGLHTRAIDGLDGPVYLALVNLFEYVQRRVRDFCAGCPFPICFGRGLRRSVSSRLVRVRRLLVDATLREDVVQVWTL